MGAGGSRVYKGRFYLFATLHNNDAILSTPPQVWRTNHLRGSIVAASDSPAGPFQVLKPNGPHPPTNFMTLDGTLYVDPVRASRGWFMRMNGFR